MSPQLFTPALVDQSQIAYLIALCESEGRLEAKISVSLTLHRALTCT